MTRRRALAPLAGALTTTAADFAPPAHACDCHTHIFGDPARFPFAARRGYTPPPAGPEEMAAFHRGLGIERVVIVTPSVYGTDNGATIHGLKARGKTARGIAVVADDAPLRDLKAMHAAGMRGIRLNLASAGQNDPAVARERLRRALARMKELGWHVQMFTTPAVIRAVKDVVAEAPVPVVFDHFGGARAAEGVAQAGFADLLELVKIGKAWVKISGAYRASALAPDYPDAAPLARALIAANPDRIVWGTDWPHPDSSGGRPFDQVSPPVPVDDARLLQQLAVWAPDAAVRRKILVENPARLYGF